MSAPPDDTIDEKVSADANADANADTAAADTIDAAPPPEATEDIPEDVPPDPGTPDAASPRMVSIVESLLFAADKALTLRQLGELLGESELVRVRAAVAAVEEHHQGTGVELHSVAGGYLFRTNPENAVWVQKLLAQKPVKMSRAQLDTLAIVSYRQPITRPEIDEIRGVDSGGTLKVLMERSLVRILGKKEEPGRPLLYGTTKDFLEFFNLRDLKDLPTLREFHELSEEHRAQVAALEGKAPAGSIEAEGEGQPEGEQAPDDAPPLQRLELKERIEDQEELAEIDRLIQTAGANLATDDDLPADEITTAPTGEFKRPAQVAGTEDFAEHSPTNTHGETIPEPDVGDHAEFESGPKTNPKENGA